MKLVRLTLGGLLLATGIIFTILPGSVLLVISGLVLLSYDWPRARGWLTGLQRTTARNARRIDTWLLARKLR